MRQTLIDRADLRKAIELDLRKALGLDGSAKEQMPAAS
jgi:hypothetical protein